MLGTSLTLTNHEEKAEQNCKGRAAPNGPPCSYQCGRDAALTTVPLLLLTQQSTPPYFFYACTGMDAFKLFISLIIAVNLLKLKGYRLFILISGCVS